MDEPKQNQPLWDYLQTMYNSGLAAGKIKTTRTFLIFKTKEYSVYFGVNPPSAGGWLEITSYKDDDVLHVNMVILKNLAEAGLDMYEFIFMQQNDLDPEPLIHHYVLHVDPTTGKCMPHHELDHLLQIQNIHPDLENEILTFLQNCKIQDMPTDVYQRVEAFTKTI